MGGGFGFHVLVRVCKMDSEVAIQMNLVCHVHGITWVDLVEIGNGGQSHGDSVATSNCNQASNYNTPTRSKAKSHSRRGAKTLEDNYGKFITIYMLGLQSSHRCLSSKLIISSSAAAPTCTQTPTTTSSSVDSVARHDTAAHFGMTSITDAARALQTNRRRPASALPIVPAVPLPLVQKRSTQTRLAAAIKTEELDSQSAPNYASKEGEDDTSPVVNGHQTDHSLDSEPRQEHLGVDAERQEPTDEAAVDQGSKAVQG